MSVDQLFGKYRRLKKDLSTAYSQPQWNAALVDRLVDEITIVEREIALRAPAVGTVAMTRPAVGGLEDCRGVDAQG